MKEVFIVFEQDEVDCTVVAVYDNLRAAEKYCAKMRGRYESDAHFYFERHVINMSVIP